MSLLSVYQAVEEYLQKLDFSLLYPGFKKYPYALYNQKQVCLAGKMFPYDERFLANTAILLDGTYTAIWNLEDEAELSPALLASQIVHEMFHCFQFENGESRFPDDLKLLAFSPDYDYYAAKYLENLCLARAFSLEAEDLPCAKDLPAGTQALERFFAVRNSRCREYGESLQEELKTETVEGVAEYVGLKALRVFHLEEYQTRVKTYLHRLEHDFPLLLDIRKSAYFTGSLFCLAAERFQPPLKNAFGEKPVYLQNFPDSHSVPSALPDTVWDKSLCLIPDVWQFQPPEALGQEFRNMTQQRRLLLSRHQKSRNYTDFPARICGYDPMNMFRMGNLLYCSHFLFLQNDAGTIRRNGPVLAVLKDDSHNEILGYY